MQSGRNRAKSHTFRWRAMASQMNSVRLLTTGSRFMTGVRTLTNLGATLALLVIMLATTADVVLRTTYRPLKGVYELTELLMALVVFLSMAYAAHKNKHITVDVLTSRLPKNISAILLALSGLVSLYVCGMLLWRVLLSGSMAITSGSVSSSLYVPLAPFIFAAAFGILLLCITEAQSLVRAFAQVRSILTWRTTVLLVLGTIFVLALILLYYWLPESTLTRPVIGVVCTALLLLLMVFGVPIGFAMMLAGLLGYGLVRGVDPGLSMISTTAVSSVMSVTFSLIPLFILMGHFTFHSGISKELYETAYRWIGHRPGGLAMATIAACGGFAACTGSSLAGTVVMGQVALPEMRQRGYRETLATGCVAAGGTLGVLIPPSTGFAFYGIMTEQSIGTLFISGIVPGVLLVAIFIGIIYAMAKLRPGIAPPGSTCSLREKVYSLKGTWGMLLLFALVIGGIYTGVFTATEGGAVGAFGALVIGVVRGKIRWAQFRRALLDTGQTTAMVFTILVGALIFGQFLTITNVPHDLAELVAGLEINRYWVLGAIFMLFIVLGMFIDVAAMVLLTVPILYPIVDALGFDAIWFGVFVVVVCEMGMITPPVGMNVFALHGIARDVPLYTIFRGITPFLIGMIILVGLLIVFPQIALFLPRLMTG